MALWELGKTVFRCNPQSPHPVLPGEVVCSVLSSPASQNIRLMLACWSERCYCRRSWMQALWSNEQRSSRYGTSKGQYVLLAEKKGVKVHHSGLTALKSTGGKDGLIPKASLLQTTYIVLVLDPEYPRCVTVFVRPLLQPHDISDGLFVGPEVLTAMTMKVLLSASCSLFYPEDGNSMLLRNVCKLLLDYITMFSLQCHWHSIRRHGMGSGWIADSCSAVPTLMANVPG